MPYIVKAPVVSLCSVLCPPSSVSDLPLTGNFTWKDEFEGAAIAPSWVMIRTPKETWWKLADGQLSLTPRADRLSGKGNPSFYGRRLQHSRFDASAKLAIPATVGTSAGLAISQNETHTYTFGVQRTEGGLSVFVEVQNGQKPQILITGQLPADAKVIELRITGDETTSPSPTPSTVNGRNCCPRPTPTRSASKPPAAAIISPAP